MKSHSLGWSCIIVGEGSKLIVTGFFCQWADTIITVLTRFCNLFTSKYFLKTGLYPLFMSRVSPTSPCDINIEGRIDFFYPFSLLDAEGIVISPVVCSSFFGSARF